MITIVSETPGGTIVSGQAKPDGPIVTVMTPVGT